MKVICSNKLLFLFLFSILFSGCALTKDSAARLYNLHNGEVIHVRLYDFYRGHGRMSAQLPDGEELNGEYTITKRDHQEMPLPPSIMQPNSEKSIMESEPEDRTQASSSQKDVKSWSEVYGFGGSASAKPAGTAIAIGNRGTVLEIVLYSANIQNGFGDGVGRDNKNNWYRIHIGELK